jgi:3-hydroxyacyl-CoA dehydrogenase
MQINQALQAVAILGAGGKMGRGIALILLQEVAITELKRTGSLESPQSHFYLIDTSREALTDMHIYLEDRLKRYAEKNINQLREFYDTSTDLVSNSEIVTAFVSGTLAMTEMTIEIESAKEANLIFEAVIEDIEVKVSVLTRAKGDRKQYFFTNTSSIPIHVLARRADLANNIIGVHFFNPPPIQKLVELIIPHMASAEATQLGIDLTNRLNKISVRSADIAGFIGNGYLMREIIFASRQVEQLAKSLVKSEGVMIINMITHDYLLRPMGIYQLIDYIGLDTCHRVLGIMSHYQHDPFFGCPLIDELLKRGKQGGQNPNGSQRDGFFQYNHLVPVASYCFETGSYKPFDQGTWVTDLSKGLGPLPKNWRSWKDLVNDPERQERIESYFYQLFDEKSPGAEVTLDFLQFSREIALGLVKDGVAKSTQDVNTVLRNGFYHLYDADIPWLDFQKVFRSIL